MYKKPLLMCLLLISMLHAPDNLRQDILQTLTRIYELCLQAHQDIRYEGIHALIQKIEKRLVPEDGRHIKLVQGDCQVQVDTVSQDMERVFSSILAAATSHLENPSVPFDFSYLDHQFGLVSEENVSGVEMPELAVYDLSQFAKLFYRPDISVFGIKSPIIFIDTIDGRTEESARVTTRYAIRHDASAEQQDLMDLDFFGAYSSRTPSIGNRTPVPTGPSARPPTRSGSKSSMAERIHGHNRQITADGSSVGIGSCDLDSQATRIQSTHQTLEQFCNVATLPPQSVNTGRSSSSKETSKQVPEPIAISSSQSQQGSPASESASVGSGPDKEKSQSPVARAVMSGVNAAKWVASSAASVATSAASSIPSLHPGKLCQGLNSAPNSSDSPELVPEMQEVDVPKKLDDPFAGLDPMNASMNSAEIEPDSEPQTLREPGVIEDQPKQPIIEQSSPRQVAQSAPSTVSFSPQGRTNTRDESFASEETVSVEGVNIPPHAPEVMTRSRTNDTTGSNYTTTSS